MLVHRLFYTATTTNPEDAKAEFIRLLLSKGYSQKLIDSLRISVVNSCLLISTAPCTIDTWYTEN